MAAAVAAAAARLIFISKIFNSLTLQSQINRVVVTVYKVQLFFFFIRNFYSVSLSIAQSVCLFTWLFVRYAMRAKKKIYWNELENSKSNNNNSAEKIPFEFPKWRIVKCHRLFWLFINIAQQKSYSFIRSLTCSHRILFIIKHQISIRLTDWLINWSVSKKRRVCVCICGETKNFSNFLWTVGILIGRMRAYTIHWFLNPTFAHLHGNAQPNTHL